MKEIIDLWERQGKVEKCNEPQLCNNPLSVIKQVQANGTVKYRPVLDCSCKVNSLLKYGTVNLDDLSSFENLIEENDYFTCFDMSSMYHHIFFNKDRVINIKVLPYHLKTVKILIIS